MSVDYMNSGLLFKTQKVIRYARIYGLSRTSAKIRGEFHLKAEQGFDGLRWPNPACGNNDVPGRCVAIIGCGKFSFSNIAYSLKRINPDFLRVTYDIQKYRARSLCRSYGGSYVVSDWKEILGDPQVKVVYIASNHASHADYAIACIESGKDVHIEKPHVVSLQQLDRLLDAMRRFPWSKVFLGFNRPKSHLFMELQAVLDRQPGPLMINWFIVGHKIPDDHWYYDEKEGGRVLGNLSHWTDMTLHLVSIERAFPCTIIPASPGDSKSSFVVTFIFADGSCASITFSAMGEVYEGVREVLNVQKGDVIAKLTDFQSLAYEVNDKKASRTLRYRDHGHEANIVHSMLASMAGDDGEPISYVEATARLFLATAQAVMSGEKVILS